MVDELQKEGFNLGIHEWQDKTTLNRIREVFKQYWFSDLKISHPFSSYA